METQKQFSTTSLHQSRGGHLLSAAACLLVGAILAPAAPAAERALQSLNYEKLPGNQAEFTLTLSGKAPKPLVFTVGNPASISVDLPGTRSEIKHRLRPIGVGNIRSAIVAQGKHRTRVVINMTDLTGYKVRTQGNKIRLRVGAGAHTRLASNKLEPDSADQPETAGRESIKKVNFRRGEKGAGRIIVHLAHGNLPVNVRRRGNKVVASFPHTHLPKHLRQRLEVMDFATPVKTVALSQQGNAARMVVTPRADTDFKEVGYQTDNDFTLELQPVTTHPAQEAEKHHYTGKRISLNFQKVSIRSLLQIIADVAGVNIVVSDKVHGTMSLRLQNVPYDQALHIILASNGLGKRKQGNVIMVAPLTTLAAKDKAQAQISQQHEKLTPLRSEIIQINYAKAADVAGLLKSNNNSLLSKRGEVSVDERTNKLLVQDTPAKLREIRGLINQLDKPVKQVSIATRIVVASNNFTRSIGTRFGVTDVTSTSNGLVSTTGSAEGNDTIVNSARNGGLPATLPSLNNRFNVNTAVSKTPAGKVALSILNSNFLVDLELSANQAEGKMNVVSTPRVITTNAKEASIERGVEIPYQRAASSGATAIQFKKATLQLKVTPQITPDGRIIMDLAVRDDTKGDNVSTGTGGQEPAINTRRIQTRVLVNNGDTVVLGGIYQHTTNDSISKVPLLGDIPLLGFLFRNKTKENNKKQILVFVTPKIINQKVNANGI